jgi:phosphatidylserine/phosphatidylglycerophosphate/cardiolipin synthase-like enzyme
MKRLPFFLLLLLVPFCQAQEPPKVQQPLPPIEVYFSPTGGCTEAVVRELNAAKSTILVQAYSFTSAPIAKAFVDTHKRGVKIQVILDKSQRTAKYSSADFVQHAGIPIWIDAKHQIAHNKIMVIDGATIITGSFNFTRAADEHNAENLLVIRSSELATKYSDNWKAHLEHSDKYEGKEKGYSERQAEQTAPAPAPRTAEVSDGFVASRNSQVFHRPDCKSAAKISAKNLIRYNTREEAIQAGKRPCAECNPKRKRRWDSSTNYSSPSRRAKTSSPEWC